jgi:GH24 family phage-related lysozyme (muramidase)
LLNAQNPEAFPMQMNARGLALLKSFEKCRLEAYLPTPDDKPTIGWGAPGRIFTWA